MANIIDTLTANIENYRASNKREARKIAAQHGAIPWNF